jgi:hypothetical protein
MNKHLYEILSVRFDELKKNLTYSNIHQLKLEIQSNKNNHVDSHTIENLLNKVTVFLYENCIELYKSYFINEIEISNLSSLDKDKFIQFVHMIESGTTDSTKKIKILTKIIGEFITFKRTDSFLGKISPLIIDILQAEFETYRLLLHLKIVR